VKLANHKHENILNSNKLKVAFLGGGVNSAVGRVHRTAVELDQRFELVAGCFSTNLASSREAAEEYKISSKRAYSTLDELLESEFDSIDALVIMTPQDQHREQVLRCLDVKLPVICEKALVSNLEEAAQIKEKIIDKGGFLAVTYNYTGYPMIRELRSMINNGLIGSIQQIQIEMPQEGFLRLSDNGEPLKPQEWRLREGIIPTISLDLGVHLHMMVSFLTGESPQEVVASSRTYGNFDGIVDSVSCMANYSNNISCSVWYSKSALGYRNGLKLRVFGDRGSAEWLQENPEVLMINDNSGGKTLVDRSCKNICIANKSRYTRFKVGHPGGFIEAFANYYFDVADSILDYKKNGVSNRRDYVYGIEESIEGLRFLDAIAKSSLQKRWIKV